MRTGNDQQRLQPDFTWQRDAYAEWRVGEFGVDSEPQKRFDKVALSSR
jgi:hypothetical protein